MTETESIFLSLFEKELIPHPFMIIESWYRPDFYCPENGSIYEICSSGRSQHMYNGHLDTAALIAPTYLVFASMKDRAFTIYNYKDTEAADKITRLSSPLKKKILLKDKLKYYRNIGGNENVLRLLGR